MRLLLPYFRFGIMTNYLVMVVVITFFRPDFLWLIFAFGLIFMTVADEYIGNSRKEFGDLNAAFLDFMLYLTLPLQLLMFALLMTYLSNGDPFGLITFSNSFGLDMAAVKSTLSSGDIAVMLVLFGFLFGAAGVNISHELFHRTNNRFAVSVGRWLLAFTLDTTFAIEHVYGHHRHVGTKDDPATARRGEALQVFWVRSTIGQVIKAFEHEARRMDSRGRSLWSWRNRAIRGQFMSLAYLCLAYYAAQWRGVAAMLLMAVIGKLFLESVNYIEHYGLVRVSGTKVAPRHSWDSLRLISNALLFNLPRHSSHHTNASLRFWNLEPNRSTPVLPYGYLVMVIIALIPPLWRRVMASRLEGWDQNFATKAELELLDQKGQAPA